MRSFVETMPHGARPGLAGLRTQLNQFQPDSRSKGTFLSRWLFLSAPAQTSERLRRIALP
jgi:hypothetical protein